MQTHVSSVRTAFTAALLGLASTIPAARAQHPHSLARASVPFAFQYGSRSFPAGQYSLSMISANVLEIQGRNSAALSLVDWTDADNQPHTGRLIFQHHGDRYVLSDIWMPQLGAHLRCPQARQHTHRELAGMKPTSSSNVDVALLDTSR